MSEWHRDNPDLVGTDRDPWYANHKSYRQALSEVKAMSGDFCRVCETFLQPHERGVCDGCRS